MTIREVVYKFLSDYSSGIPSDDTRLRPRKVYSALQDARARILADALPNVSEHNYFTLTCVSLEETTAHECGCIPVDGCFYYKASCQLPQTITNSKELISDVTTLDGNIRFSQVDWNEIKYSQYDKYTANDPKYFIRNGFVYLVNVPKRLEVVSIRGLFDDILSISSDCYECDEAYQCGSALDKEFPIDRKYMPRIYQVARFILGGEGKEDKIPNNSED